MVNGALAWLEQLGGDERFFCWVHLYDPHTPYSPPSPWMEKYRDRPYDGEMVVAGTAACASGMRWGPTVSRRGFR